jgi:hypothetical protein
MPAPAPALKVLAQPSGASGAPAAACSSLQLPGDQQRGDALHAAVQQDPRPCDDELHGLTDAPAAAVGGSSGARAAAASMQQWVPNSSAAPWPHRAGVGAVRSEATAAPQAAAMSAPRPEGAEEQEDAGSMAWLSLQGGSSMPQGTGSGSGYACMRNEVRDASGSGGTAWQQ